MNKEDERFINNVNNLIKQNYVEDVDMNDVFYGEHIKAIENLIQENKELKEKAKNTMKLIGANYIHKNKVKEKIEVIQKRMKKETRTDFLITLKILENELQELLKEGE